jgi:hypothetical protein
VGQAQSEELQAGRLEEQVAIALAEIAVAGDPIAKLADHVDGRCEDGVELQGQPSYLKT